MTDSLVSEIHSWGLTVNPQLWISFIVGKWQEGWRISCRPYTHCSTIYSNYFQGQLLGLRYKRLPLENIPITSSLSLLRRVSYLFVTGFEMVFQVHLKTTGIVVIWFRFMSSFVGSESGTVESPETLHIFCLYFKFAPTA